MQKEGINGIKLRRNIIISFLTALFMTKSATINHAITLYLLLYCGKEI